MSLSRIKQNFSSLPPPSILQKIAELDPEGVAKIIDTTERIEAARHVREHQAQNEAFREKMKSPATLWRGLCNVFNLFGLFDNKPVQAKYPVHSETQKIENSWIMTGNDMREAIELYFLDHPHIAQTIVLSKAEEEALRPVALNAVANAQRHLSR